MANSYFNENTLEELIEEIKYVYKSDDRPWVIGYSGGNERRRCYRSSLSKSS